MGLDEIYKTLALDKIPWNIESPPDALVELVENGRFEPGKIIDLGCGAGNYAIYFAGRGFEVTGIDISPTAVELARRNAAEKSVECEFMAADMLEDLDFDEAFDLAYDWEVLHHIFPEQRKRYTDNVYKILKPGGKYFSLCFSEDDPQFGSSKKIRETKLGTVLYFSSEAEIKELFEPRFNILELKTIQVKGKFAPHQAIYALMNKE